MSTSDSPLDRAVQIASQAHAGQLDKQGQPYITHPLAVMARVHDHDAKVVAVLHDVIEDTATTADDLRRAGISDELIAAVELVTHAPEESYADYVVCCKAHPIARRVKLADLGENYRVDRVLFRPDRAERDLARIHRYLLSYKFLTDEITEADYRRLMAVHGVLDAQA
jgi:hypothetical protein